MYASNTKWDIVLLIYREIPNVRRMLPYYTSSNGNHVLENTQKDEQWSIVLRFCQQALSDVRTVKKQTLLCFYKYFKQNQVLWFIFKTLHLKINTMETLSHNLAFLCLLQVLTRSWCHCVGKIIWFIHFQGHCNISQRGIKSMVW